jgi:hypothetical protein
LAWIYSGQDYHNFLTHNFKLSHGEWKAFGLNLFKPSRRFVRIFCTILFTIVRIFWLRFIQDKITITSFTHNCKLSLFEWKAFGLDFSSQILEIEAPFAVLA